MKRYLLLSLFAASISGCGYPLSLVGLNGNSDNNNRNNNTTAATPIDPELQKAALTTLSKNCSACHGAGSGSADVYGLDDIKHMVSSGLIVPGQPDKSLLFKEIQSGSMPPSGPLSQDDKDLIYDFIVMLGKVKNKPPPGNKPSPRPTPPVPTPVPTPEPTPTPNPEPVPVKPEPTFSYIETEILIPKCVACHRAGKARGGYAFDKYESTLKAVDTESPSKSKIYTETQSGSMPPRPRPSLNSEELNLILNWIEKGAQNN